MPTSGEEYRCNLGHQGYRAKVVPGGNAAGEGSAVQDAYLATLRERVQVPLGTWQDEGRSGSSGRMLQLRARLLRALLCHRPRSDGKQQRLEGSAWGPLGHQKGCRQCGVPQLRAHGCLRCLLVPTPFI
eukprot:1160990-Pelagomonas_calceolata.AAC.6